MIENLIQFAFATSLVGVISKGVFIDGILDTLFIPKEYTNEVIHKEVEEFFNALGRHHDNACEGKNIKFPYRTIFDDCIENHSNYDDMQKKLKLVHRKKMTFDEFLNKRMC